MQEIGIGFPFSPVIKFGVFLLVLVRLIHLDNVKFFLSLTIVYLLLLIFNIYTLGEDIGSAIVFISKPITTFFIFYYFLYYRKINAIVFNTMLKKVVLYNFLILAANIILGLMGYGTNVYEVGTSEDEGLGIKGFIIAQNEISLMVAMVFPILLWMCSQKYKRIIYYLLCIVVIVISFCISTKASIVISLVSVAFVSYYTGAKREKKIIVLTVLILLFIFISYISVVLDSEIGFIQRFSYFMESRGLLDAIFSGRLEQLEIENRIFFENTDFFSRLVGKGWVACELDPFQALYSFGYIGGLMNMILLLFIYFNPRVKSHKSTYERVVVLSNTVIFLLSFTSGHVFLSSMGGLFLALSNASVYSMRKKETGSPIAINNKTKNEKVFVHK
jgi:hypothetical protein